MAAASAPLVTVDSKTGLMPRPERGGPQDLFYRRKYTTWYPTIIRGEGIYVWDDRGNRYIDAISGAGVNNLGQGNQRVVQAFAKQPRKLPFTYVRYARHPPNLRLSDLISGLAGKGF